MLRVPLTVGIGPADAGAPLLTGTIVLHGREWSVDFLVDTGAHSTTTNGAKMDKVNEVFDKGTDAPISGVGGGWPARVFKGAVLQLQVDDSVINLDLPALRVAYPYALTVAGPKSFEHHGAFNPTGLLKKWKDAKVRECHLPALLGRDVFHHYRINLHWVPRGDGYIELPIDEAPARQEPQSDPRPGNMATVPSSPVAPPR